MFIVAKVIGNVRDNWDNPNTIIGGVIFADLDQIAHITYISQEVAYISDNNGKAVKVGPISFCPHIDGALSEINSHLNIEEIKT